MIRRPSILPMLAQCPHFQGQGGAQCDAGTARHSILSAIMSKEEPFMPSPFEGEIDEDYSDGSDLVTERERDGLSWAADYIRIHAPMADYPLEIEKKGSFVGPDFSDIQGTPDYVCGPVILDLKWRRRDYTAQMACYALMAMEQGHKRITCHLLFAESKTAQVIEFDEASALAVIEPILAKAGTGEYTPCDYCGWCARCIECPAMVARVNAVADGREDWALEQYHPSDMTDPDEIGKGLTLAKVIKKWVESMEFHAREKAIKEGIVATGYEVKSQAGNRFVSSVTAAFPLVGMPQEQFLSACEVKLSALAEAYAKFTGIKKAPAERDIVAKLGEVIQHKPAVISLVAIKSKE